MAKAPRARSSRRWGRRLVVIALAVAIAAVAYLVRSDRRPTTDLTRPILRVLTALDEGEADSLYQAAHSLFREDLPVTKLAEISATMTAVLGEPESVASSAQARVLETALGNVATASVDLKYSSATVRGSFSFIQEGDEWLLLSMHVPVPPSMVEAYTAKIHGDGRFDPPPEVKSLALDVMKWLRRGEFRMVMEIAAPNFAVTVDEEVLARMRSVWQARLGTMREGAAIVEGAQNRGKTGAWVLVDLPFDDDGLSVRVDFRWSDTGWRLSGIKPVIDSSVAPAATETP